MVCYDPEHRMYATKLEAVVPEFSFPTNDGNRKLDTTGDLDVAIITQEDGDNETWMAETRKLLETQSLQIQTENQQFEIDRTNLLNEQRLLM